MNENDQREDFCSEYHFPVGQKDLDKNFLTCALTREMHKNDVGMSRRRFREHSYERTFFPKRFDNLKRLLIIASCSLLTMIFKCQWKV